MSKKWESWKRGLEPPKHESFPGLFIASSEDEDWVDEDAPKNNSAALHSEQESTSSSASEAFQIPKISDDLFEVEMERLSSRAGPQHTPGAKCDSAYCIPASEKKRCFEDDNSGQERIDPEALKFVLASFESLSKPTMLKTIENMDPAEKKMVKTRYANHVTAITRRVRQKLARIYVPKKYSKGIYLMDDIDSCNRRYVAEIKECENVTAKLVPEVERLQEKVDHLINEKTDFMERLQKNNDKNLGIHPLLQTRIKSLKSANKTSASPAFKSSLESLFESAADSATFTDDYSAKKTSIPLEDVICNLISPYDNVVKEEVD
mmetsp:Transcript_24023/g.37032  ORF Transcript_24023/g.37032 Transcript_24023/m.37032 type:complete len:320 (-) Transcript_24023:98-1057(-)|eukprot:CAMPEP_0196816464 /NCGR_PEP_ID=MMETSP1362-20130617/55416_1 /TAXON_ID=163516 /ORGANISM="Leptocylindrus danicus, Strain CCMP1856" /LENGTH=319 /DNA_ID=CAMNT_0042193807 /DNA_START=61 /DNA_END=1020 /DNA_ORIENTATION=-